MTDSASRIELLNRRFAGFVALGGLALGAMWIAEQWLSPTRQAWWAIAGYAVLLFGLLIVAVGATRMRSRTLYILLCLMVVLGFLLQVLTFQSLTGEISPEVWQTGWMLTGVYLSFIALLLRASHPYLTINLFAALVATFPALSFWFDSGFVTVHMVVVTLVQFTNVGYPVVLLALRARLMHYGARQDRWRQRAVDAAATREELREARRLGSAVHDRALGVLTQVMWSGGAVDDALRSSARAALTLLEEQERRSAGEVNVEEIDAVLPSDFAQIDPEVSVVVLRNEGTLPSIVIASLLDAALEALRNSAKHAPAAHRKVLISFQDDCARVVVSDDGPGFSPSIIGENRLGVSGSIVARMRDLPGGEARVVTSPGSGTEVVLTWRRE